MAVMAPYVIMGKNYIGGPLYMTPWRLAITCWLNGGPHNHRLISGYGIRQGRLLFSCSGMLSLWLMSVDNMLLRNGKNRSMYTQPHTVQSISTIRPEENDRYFPDLQTEISNWMKKLNENVLISINMHCIWFPWLNLTMSQHLFSNDLAPRRQQAIDRTNDDHDYWHIYTFCCTVEV